MQAMPAVANRAPVTGRPGSGAKATKDSRALDGEFARREAADSLDGEDVSVCGAA